MKSYRPSSKVPIDFYDLAVNSKHDDAVKTFLLGLRPQISLLYDEYNKRFQKVDLHNLSPQVWNHNEKDELIKLYSMKRSCISELFYDLTKNDAGNINTLCPYCQIDIAHTLDHIVPKEKMAGFSVHVLNLIPCCHCCNEHKSEEWKEDNELRFINYYQDQIPNVEYLKCEISLKNNSFVTKFWVDSNALDGEKLKDKIIRHYSRLCLCDRYSQESFKVIEWMNSQLRNHARLNLPDKIIKQIILNMVSDDDVRYGINYWQSILKKAICRTDAVFQFLKANNV